MRLILKFFKIEMQIGLVKRKVNGTAVSLSNSWFMQIITKNILIITYRVTQFKTKTDWHSDMLDPPVRYRFQNIA